MNDAIEKYDLIFASVVFIGVLGSFIAGYIVGNKRKRKDENYGEGAVRQLLTEYCRHSTAHLLNNVTVEFGNGTTQIDHILITQNGILVIETKKYSGWLFANENQKEWTQIIFQVKNRFYNPIYQNIKHVQAVQQILDFIPKEQIQSLVVFAGNAEFKTEIPSGVIYIDELADYVNGITFGSISENRVQFCVGRLEHKRFEITHQTDVEHQAYLEYKFGVIDG